MPVPDHTNSEVVFKIVYAGAEGAGKTTSLAGVHQLLGAGCEQAVGAETGSDHTVVFGYRPPKPVMVRGMRARFQMMTVPGPVHYAATWQLALRGADGVIFVADSSPDRLSDNAAALKATFLAMKQNRANLAEVPMVFQLNKRDLPDALPVGDLDSILNVLQPKAQLVESCAARGEGLLSALEVLSRQMLARFGGVSQDQAPAQAAAVPPVPTEQPAPQPQMAEAC